MSKGFTLVELLVVIAVIVILLALLAPALDQAIYQAELTVCASRQGAIATGAITYAAASNRSYPHRPGPKSGQVWHAAWIYNGNPVLTGAYVGTSGGQADVYDDRPALRTFLSLNEHLNDPLTGPLDYEDIDIDSHAYANYALWFGYGYLGHRGMYRLGDRLEWRDPRENRPVLRSHDLLVSDRDDLQAASLRTQTAHADRAGLTANIVVQNGQFDLEVTGTGADSLKLTISTWSSLAGRGEVDLNYAFQDGSVRQSRSVERLDADMETLPDLSAGPLDWFLTVPPANR